LRERDVLRAWIPVHPLVHRIIDGDTPVAGEAEEGSGLSLLIHKRL
jgi:hypothetical protein